jgi:hypothetical protein
VIVRSLGILDVSIHKYNVYCLHSYAIKNVVYFKEVMRHNSDNNH